MSQSPRRDPAHLHNTSATRSERVRRRRPGWGNAAVMRTAALVIGMYLVVQLVWFAHYLVLIAFLGVLFGLAIAAGVDRLERYKIPRGAGAALIVIAFFGLLVGFGAWMAPTLHAQSIELRRRLPDAIDRVEAWLNSHRTGVIGVVVNSVVGEAKADSTAAEPRDTAPLIPIGPPLTAADSARLAAHQAKSDTISLNATFRHRVNSGFSGVTRFLFPFLSSTATVVTGFLITVFLSIYIAADPEMYRRGIMHLFPRAKRQRAGEILSAIAGVLRRWLVTQLIAMLTIGVVSTVVLALMGVKAALALGVLAGLLEFVPTVGPLMSALVGSSRVDLQACKLEYSIVSPK